MSVRFWTGSARSLLYAFEQGVHEGRIAQWMRNADGDFTHASEFLKDKAFMRPKVYSDTLAFAILSGEGAEMTDQIFGIYQACLIQSFLTYFSDKFSLADASSGFRERDGDLGRVVGPQGYAAALRPAIRA